MIILKPFIYVELFNIISKHFNEKIHSPQKISDILSKLSLFKLENGQMTNMRKIDYWESILWLTT